MLTVDDIIFCMIFVMTVQVEQDQERIPIPKAPEPSGQHDESDRRELLLVKTAAAEIKK